MGILDYASENADGEDVAAAPVKKRLLKDTGRDLWGSSKVESGPEVGQAATSPIVDARAVVDRSYEDNDKHPSFGSRKDQLQEIPRDRAAHPDGTAPIIDGYRQDGSRNLPEAEEATPRTRDFSEIEIIRLERVDGNHLNAVYRAELADGRRGFLKPEFGERYSGRSDIPAHGQWRREIAAYEFDHAVGLGLVPETVARRDSDLGLGNASLQAEVPRFGHRADRRARPCEKYTESDRQAMAVLDYILGNTDRHNQNYLTNPDGRPAAIDNGLCLPEGDQNGIRSQWVADYLGKPLNETLVDRLKALNHVKIAERFHECGIEERAIGGFLDRLREVCAAGAITGETWRGEIYDGNIHTWNIARGRI